MTQSTGANQQQNGFNRRKYATWCGSVRVLTSIQVRCFVMTSREPPGFPRILLTWKVCEEEWCKIPPNCCADLIHNWKCLWRLLSPKVGQTVIKSTLHCVSLQCAPKKINIYIYLNTGNFLTWLCLLWPIRPNLSKTHGFTYLFYATEINIISLLFWDI